MCPRSIARIFKIQIRISSAYSLLPKKTPTQGIKAHTPKKIDAAVSVRLCNELDKIDNVLQGNDCRDGGDQ